MLVFLCVKSTEPSGPLRDSLLESPCDFEQIKPLRLLALCVRSECYLDR